ncbi:hypothetical protein TRVL_00601 [Trypanosoma vivax]|nr:hypothetical protein TRVL_00601 [Trypanosoma vivax]
MEYTDIYLRQRHGEVSSPSQAVRAPEGGPAMDTSASYLLKGAFSVQQLFDRLEALSVRVDAFDEKMVNIIKLVKLAQGLQEEKESDLQRQVRELRLRLKKQEHTTAELQKELQEARGGIPLLVQEAVQHAWEAVKDSTTRLCEQNSERLAQAKLGMESALHEVEEKLRIHVASVRRDLDSSRSLQEEQVVGLQQKVLLVEKNVRDLEASCAHHISQFSSLESSVHSVSDSFDLIKQKVHEATLSVEALKNSKNAMHELCVDEIESTRQWVARNLQRVKQHMEVVSADVSQLQSEHVNLSARIERLSCQASVECRRLRSQLAQKAREAEALDSIVEKEFSKVGDVAKRHEGLRSETGVLKDLVF